MGSGCLFLDPGSTFARLQLGPYRRRLDAAFRQQDEEVEDQVRRLAHQFLVRAGDGESSPLKRRKSITQ